MDLMISGLIGKSKSSITALTSLGYIIKYELTPQFSALIVAINYSAFGLIVNAPN